MKDLSAVLSGRERDGLYRRRRVAESPQSPKMVIDGKSVLSFCSNDYLGLANHPAVKQAFVDAAVKYGVGSGAAHLINGHSKAHHALEEELAAFLGYPRALLFSTGYMANLGVAQALVGRKDVVFEDRLNHASLLDAGLLSGARLIRYRHGDADDLARRLTEYRHQSPKGECLVMTDGVFSMDGDIAPLVRLSDVCKNGDAWLMVDDAHGLGVLGDHGCGSVEYHGLNAGAVPVLMGTLGKAFGTFGAFVAGDHAFIEYLIQSARTYIYTTAAPPAVAEAARAALRIVGQEPERREKLRRLVGRFREGAEQLGLPVAESVTPIQPIIVGEAAVATELSNRLMDHNILITAIRPPTVPRGTARLRITFSASHTEQHVDYLLGVLESCDAAQIIAGGAKLT